MNGKAIVRDKRELETKKLRRRIPEAVADEKDLEPTRLRPPAFLCLNTMVKVP